MGIGDFINKGKDALGNEEQSDKLLDGASDGINKVTGGKFEDQVSQGRDFADGHVGDGDEGNNNNENNNNQQQ
ncbi:antitoxin [Agrococcus casei]|uniref:Antitoxin n=1 Tax=Agrococcus casei LMG 22410 TaxID=1255656 RepID=A0A1R4FAM7_9MICO|nr:antitoxin [Agrococcus casei]SJM52968.1 hypothetical protein CZ674_03505 [Agrococcus casei LMG 22410]